MKMKMKMKRRQAKARAARLLGRKRKREEEEEQRAAFPGALSEAATLMQGNASAAGTASGMAMADATF